MAKTAGRQNVGSGRAPILSCVDVAFRDVPPLVWYDDCKPWDEWAPTKDSLSHYRSRGDKLIMPAMIPRMAQGEPMPMTLDWAAKEDKAFDRT
jgi:hypothetical protein